MVCCPIEGAYIVEVSPMAANGRIYLGAVWTNAKVTQSLCSTHNTAEANV